MSFPGSTVIPGLIGMHDHLFYETDTSLLEQPYSFPRLYLASGVTTIRTAGAVSPWADLLLAKLAGTAESASPRILFSGPYVDGGIYRFSSDSKAAAATRDEVGRWIARGATNVKVYDHASRAQLSEAIAVAHDHGVKVTGHLCSITFQEAAALGIDNLEHGLLVATDLYPGKKLDVCPNNTDSIYYSDVDGAEVQSIISAMLKHHVALTSTLAVFETFAPGHSEQRMIDLLPPKLQQQYLRNRAKYNGPDHAWWARMLQKEMRFEKEFADRGGLLMNGADPTGYGGVLAGFADQRGVELLVQAGFAPAQAIQIATANAAKFLGMENEIGTLLPGRRADMVLVSGDPAERIENIENVEIVFRDGVGYSAKKLLQSVKGKFLIH
jgi:hypothetical protein